MLDWSLKIQATSDSLDTITLTTITRALILTTACSTRQRTLGEKSQGSLKATRPVKILICNWLRQTWTKLVGVSLRHQELVAVDTTWTGCGEGQSENIGAEMCGDASRARHVSSDDLWLETKASHAWMAKARAGRRLTWAAAWCSDWWR